MAITRFNASNQTFPKLMGNGLVSGRAFDHTSDRYTIEPVLPEHPGEG